MKKWIKYIIGAGVLLLLISLLLNILGVRKVNYYKDQQKEWKQQREQLVEIADSLKKENILIDDQITEKQEAFKKLEDEKETILNSIDSLGYDEVLRILTDRYFGDSDNP